MRSVSDRPSNRIAGSPATLEKAAGEAEQASGPQDEAGQSGETQPAQLRDAVESNKRPLLNLSPTGSASSEFILLGSAGAPGLQDAAPPSGGASSDPAKSENVRELTTTEILDDVAFRTTSAQIRKLTASLRGRLEDDGQLSEKEYAAAGKEILPAFLSIPGEEEAASIGESLVDFAHRAPGAFPDWLAKQFTSASSTVAAVRAAESALSKIEGAIRTNEVVALVALLRDSLAEDGHLAEAEYAAIGKRLASAFLSLESPGDEEVLSVALRGFAQNAPGEFQKWLADQVDSAMASAQKIRAALGALEPIGSSTREVEELVDCLCDALNEDQTLSEREYSKAGELVTPAFLSLASLDEAESLRSALVAFAESAPGAYGDWLAKRVQGGFDAIVPIRNANAALDRIKGGATTKEVERLVDLFRDFMQDGSLSEGEYATAGKQLWGAFASLATGEEAERLRSELVDFAKEVPGAFQDWLAEKVESAFASLSSVVEANAALDPIAGKIETDAVEALVEHLRAALQSEGALSEQEYSESKKLLLDAFSSVKSPEQTETLRSALLDFAQKAPGAYQDWLAKQVESVATQAESVRAAYAALDVLAGKLETGEVEALVEHLRAALQSDGSLSEQEYAHAKGMLLGAFGSLEPDEPTETLRSALVDFAQKAPGGFQEWLAKEVNSAVTKRALIREANAALDAIESGQVTDEIQALVEHLRKSLDDGFLQDTEYANSKELVPAAFASLETPDEIEALRASLNEFAQKAPGEYETWFKKQVELAAPKQV